MVQNADVFHLTAQSVDLLRRMVAVPSETFGEAAVADMLQETLSGWNLPVRRVGNNLVVPDAAFSAAKPTLVLDAHIDTVPPALSYTRDPYDAGSVDDVIYGLGSNDDGGCVVAMIAAFRALNGRQLPFNLVLALSAEEEMSGDGGASFLYGEYGPAEVRNADWVLVGEPTGMKAATSERGLLVIDGLAEGISGHAARGDGLNALYIALDDINALRAHRFDRISPLMGEVKLNVTQINAGTAHNVIPDKCSFVVDVRPTEQYANEELLAALRGLCNSRLTARKLTNRSSATFSGSPLLETVAALGIETFSSPTTSNWMRIGRDALKMGPGESSRSHGADEYILRSEIETGVEGYLEFIGKFYGNTLEQRNPGH